MTAAGALALTSLTGCTSFDNDDAVATVGKEEIPAGVANFYARMQQAQYETYYAPMMGTTGEALWQQEMEEGKTYEESTKGNTSSESGKSVSDQNSMRRNTKLP